MGLPWSRMDNTWPWNPKFLEVVGKKPLDPAGLFWASVAFASGQDTGGHIAPNVLPVIHGTKARADQLLYAGLWVPGVVDGWDIKNFGEYQMTTLTAQERKDRSRRANDKRWHSDEGGRS